MKIKNMQDEKKILDALKKADTYFSDEFSDEEIEKMKNNIDNDCSLLYGIRVGQNIYDEVYYTWKSINDDTDRLSKENFELGNHVSMLQNDLLSWQNDYEFLQKEYYKLISYIVKQKIRDNISLSNDEKKWVLNNLK